MHTYGLRLDYATFVFEDDSVQPELISDSLAGEGSDLLWRRFGDLPTSPFGSPYGLYYKTLNSYGNASMCQVSGVGCRKFELTLPVLRDAYSSHFSRLDFAFDVIMTRSEWREFVKRAFSESIDSERQAKVFRLSGTGEAMTIYIGARQSERFFRIYNKTLEDPEYVFQYDGQEIPLSEDECVIRYEVEFHRFRRTLRGEKIVLDPSWMFDSYYSEDASDLFAEVKKQWLSYGADFLLPEGFADCEFETILPKDLFCRVGDPSTYQQVLDGLQMFPHSFDHSLHYVVDRFGQYLPYILQSKQLFMRCMIKARVKFGWDQPINYYFGDFENLSSFAELPDSDDVPLEFYQYEQLGGFLE